MSLRSDVHSAFDAVAPELGGMPERVVQTVIAEHRTRQRKERIVFQLRAPLSLVAVLVLIAVVAAVLVGGRLVQDWNAFHGSPAGQVPLTPLQKLEARPLHVPVIRSLTDCTDGPHNASGSYGSGPVYLDGGGKTDTSWGSYFNLSAYSDVRINGPVLIRAVDALKKNAVIFVEAYAAGPVVGTDVVDGKSVDQHTEAVLYTVQPVPDSNRFFWQFIAGEPATASAQTEWQIDAASFSEVFVTC